MIVQVRTVRLLQTRRGPVASPDELERLRSAGPHGSREYLREARRQSRERARRRAA